MKSNKIPQLNHHIFLYHSTPKIRLALNFTNLVYEKAKLKSYSLIHLNDVLGSYILSYHKVVKNYWWLFKMQLK